jgi:hypothetical protein
MKIMHIENLEPQLGADAEVRANRQLSRVDSRIRDEHDYISSRIGWLFSSHAFLFIALASLLSQPPTSLSGLRVIRTVMMIALPLIGVISSYLIWQAIRAAVHVLSSCRELRRSLEGLLATQFQDSVVTPIAQRLKAGDRPPMWLPLILGAVWLLLLSLIGTDVVHTVIHDGVFAIAKPG